MFHQWLVVIVAFATTAGVSPAADIVEEAQKKLNDARAAYFEQVDKVRQDVAIHFESRQAALRKDVSLSIADLKKAVDAIDKEKTEFQTSGTIPPSAPAVIRQKFATARKDLEVAYESALKVYLRNGRKALADEAEAELVQLKNSAGPPATDWAKLAKRLYGKFEGNNKKGVVREITIDDMQKGFSQKGNWYIVEEENRKQAIESVKALIKLRDGARNLSLGNDKKLDLLKTARLAVADSTKNIGAPIIRDMFASIKKVLDDTSPK